MKREVNPWTVTEHELIKKLRARGMTALEIAGEMGRTLYSVQAAIKKLQLKRGPRQKSGKQEGLVSKELPLPQEEVPKVPRGVYHNHTILVDGSMSVTLRIPETMTVTELKGLLLKANRLFNLSGQKDELIGVVQAVQANAGKFQGRTRRYVKIPPQVSDFLRRNYRGDNIDELIQEIMQKYNVVLDRDRLKKAAYRAGYRA